MANSHDPRFPLRSGALRPVIAAGVAGLILSLALFFTIRAWELREAQTLVRAAAEQRMELLRETVGNSLEVLHSLGSFFAAGSPVDRARFRRFAADALSRRPELQALSWTPRVPAAGRAAFEERARAEGFKEFEFTERDSKSGRRVRAHDGLAYYYPVYFIEPLDRNWGAFGYDLNGRRETLEAARDSAQPVATPPTQLMQEPTSAPGVIVYLSLYSGAIPPTVEERQSTNIGFVAAVFRIPDLVGPALARQPGLAVDLRESTPSESVPFEYQVPRLDDTRQAKRLAPCLYRLPFAGREWLITFTPTVGFRPDRMEWQSGVVLAGGLIFTTLLMVYLVSSLRRNSEVAETNVALQSEIRERKRAEEAVAAANRAKSDFLANLSHEIRTPLNSILGYTQILERDRALSFRHRDSVAALANSGHHLLGLLNSILDLAKIEAGRMELQRETFDPAALVQGLAEMFKPSCVEKRLAMRVSCPPVGAHHVLGDEGKLRQVLINLLGNAVKFTASGEIYIGVRHDPKQRDRWSFEVIDTGIGLSPKECCELFQPFQQTKAGQRHGGTGLGLAIARGHVELMGGAIEVQSEPGLGTRFHFTLSLPAAVVESSFSKQKGLPHLSPGIAVRVLVVDDNRDNRVILTRLLSELGCAVAEAATGTGASDIVRQAVPDILFIDVRLSDTDGPALLSELRANGLPASTPVLFHTAAILDTAQRDALRVSGADLLFKPFRAEDLCACLRRLSWVEFTAPAVDEAGPPPPSLGELQQIVLPDDLCARISVAAELHSTTILKTYLEEVRHLGGPATALADHLRLLLRSYDFEGIARLLSRIRVQPGAPTP